MEHMLIDSLNTGNSYLWYRNSADTNELLWMLVDILYRCVIVICNALIVWQQSWLWQDIETRA